MTKPNVLIAGFPKCGSTYLWGFLKQHPDIFVPSKFHGNKEINFFSKHSYYFKKTRCSPVYRRGLKWYYSHFNSNKKIRLDSSIMDAFDITSARRVREALGNIKILFVIREKEGYLNSLYKKMKHTGNISLKTKYEDFKKFAFVLRLADFETMIKPYIDEFGEKNVLIIKLEDIKLNPKKVLDKLLMFLDLKSYNFNYKVWKNTTNDLVYKKTKRFRRLFSMFLNELGILYYIHLLREKSK